MSPISIRHLAITLLASIAIATPQARAEKIEYLKYGDFSNWVTRHLHESAIIGGNDVTLYAIGPRKTIEGNVPYTSGGQSPWASSNVYAKVAGIVKTSNAVYPCDRGGGNTCAKMTTVVEHLKVLGIVNMDVMVTGSIFLGNMLEPITSTSNPYGKLDMGIPYTRRPTHLILDYKADVPATNTRMRATGMSPKKTIQGRDMASVFIILQRRWEDSDGNIHAMRVGTGGETISRQTDWVNAHRIPIHYGDASQKGNYKWNKLLTKTNTYYALNSHGKLMPIIEEGWDSPDATPTHAIVFLSSGYYEPFVGTEGLNLYADNIGFVL